ncbi:hypothetical protein VSDG_09584 [Cytospora chrysosperma]|uniref:Uncharacterized protein n=1 Tax=Cytospora chrysosperma TaxID=252740 RepID=A0A423VA93_CYTCH|nr:hypothetical protein VSDG_09584 [Valsa sordida]
MSHPAKGEGDEPSITPSNPRGTFAGGQRQRASTSWTTPAQQLQQVSAPPSGRRRASTRMPTMEPFIEEEEEREEGGLPGTEATVQPPSARNPQPTPTRDDSRRVSFSYSVPSAITPLHTPDEPGTRTPSPRVNPLPAIRNWWSPRSKPAPEQQPDPSPEAASATVGQEEQAAQAVSVSGTPPPHAQGEEAQQPGADEPSEVPPTTEDNTLWEGREVAQWGDHGPGYWDSGEWPAGHDGEVTPHDAQDDSTSAQSGAATPWRTSVRGQDDYNFGDVDFQSSIRARAFDNLLKKVQAEGLFLDEGLFYRIRYFARINEPKIDLEVLDDMNDESTRTLSGWLIDNGRDIPQGLQDRIVSEVTRILGDMRDRIGTLLIEESTYVKVFADDLEVLLKRPSGRTRSLISGVSSALSVPLPEHDFEELDRDHLRSLSKEAVIDFLFTRDMQRQSHINSLHAVCDDYEARMTELEEEIRYIEFENSQQRAAEQDLVQDAINSVIGHITAEDVTPVRDTASQPSSASTKALRTRATTLASASSGRSQSSARSVVSAGVGFAPISAPATAPLSMSEIPPIPIEGLDGPADPIRRQLLEDLRDIWRNEEAEDEMAHRFIRELARSANVAIRPDMEEGSRVDPTALAFATAESITPEQLLARIRRVTMERDRARRAESEAQDQLRSRLAMQQQPSTTPAGLIRRISSVFMRGRQSTSAAVTAPATALPTASLNHPSLVRLLRIVSQMADELSGCSFAASNLAQTMARCGKMDTDKSPVLPALNDLRAIVRTLRIEKPESPTENDLAGGNELWQALYLDDMEGYMILVRRQVARAISTLENCVDEWDRTNKRANNNTRSDARRQSSTITTQAAGVVGSSQQGEADKLDDSAEEWPGVENAPEQAPASVSEPATRISTFRDLLLNDPLLAVLTLVWNTIIFLTIEQLRSVLVIVWFVLSAVWYYVRLALYFVLRFLARQNGNAISQAVSLVDVVPG